MWGKLNLSDKEMSILTQGYVNTTQPVTTADTLPNVSSASTVTSGYTERGSINVTTVTPETGVNYVKLLNSNIHYLCSIKKDKRGVFTAIIGNEGYESHDFVDVCIWLASKLDYNLDD